MQFNKPSEHSNLYKGVDTEMQKRAPEPDDYKFQKHAFLNKQYEMFLELDRKQIEKDQPHTKEPMERVGNKIRKGLPLSVKDLTTWAHYNFLVLPEEEQDRLRGFVYRESKINSYVAVSMPIVGFATYAISKYSLKGSLFTNVLLTSAVSAMLYNGFYFGLLRDKKKALDKMYELYKDDVTKPQFRGLKLYGDKNVNQFKGEARDWTSSAIDDVKYLLAK